MKDLISQNIYDENQYQQHGLGEMGVDKFGRKFKYVQAGGSALVTGNLLQEAAEDVQFRSMAVYAAAAIGATSVQVTLGSTATTANMFEGGDLVVESSTGIGQAFKIDRHTVTAGAAVATFYLDRPLKIALTTSSQVSVRKSSFDGVIAYPTTPTGAPVGIALYAMTAAYYGWVQSGGDAAVLFDNQTDAAADESALMPSRAVAGSVGVVTEALAAPIHIGWMREQIGVDSTMCFAHIIID